MTEHKTPSFSSKVGLILATAGSAVGLGNIWKFPYEAGQGGGGAFLIVYLICCLLFGLPMLMTELYIGKQSQKSAYGAFRKLSNNNRWQWMSWVCIITALLITGFYFEVTGWCFHYLFAAIGNSFKGMTAVTMQTHFAQLMSNKWALFGYSMIAVVATACVLWFDVNKGIERLSKILMPLLLVMMILMVIRVLILDGSHKGLEFFFKVDFTKMTPTTILSALGQCLLSLSVGVGALITYGAYMQKSQNITATSLQVVILDTGVAVLAGMLIFPAVFAFGVDPAEGPQLVFVVLPAIFEMMSFAWLSGIFFFLLLCIAAITSTISLMEVIVAFINEASAKTRHPLNRHKSVIIVSAMIMLTIGACVFREEIFNWSDNFTANILIPLNALAMTIFVGWFLPKKDLLEEFGKGKRFKHYFALCYLQIVRYFIPLTIVIIFLNGLGLWDAIQKLF